MIQRINELESETFSNVISLWTAAGRPVYELNELSRVIAERAFIAHVWPKRDQIAEWKAKGIGVQGLTKHIAAVTGKLVTRNTAERLWRLFTNQPQPRRTQTLLDFLRGLPSQLRCAHCGETKGTFHIDHMIPLRKGGNDAVTNLQVLCQTCNLRKGAALDPKVIYISFVEEEK